MNQGWGRSLPSRIVNKPVIIATMLRKVCDAKPFTAQTYSRVVTRARSRSTSL
ncbi:hypothetical protein [Microcoleus anatoxicus]|uniref:hypothetical protein n=1 Tax=Microcoleus anatoxicus TaxID=2705319 RepID=UPI0030C93AD3